MPTLVLEDGTGASASANTYVEVTDVDTYCINRGLTDWATLSTTDRETAILRGMDYIETQDFRGVRMVFSQPLEWPRYGVYSEYGDLSLLPSESLVYYQEIPKLLKNAVCQAAYEESQSAGCLLESVTDNIKREKIDVIETEYFDNKPSTTVYRVIEGHLKTLLKPKGMAKVKRT